jgi:hypothetical protein
MKRRTKKRTGTDNFSCIGLPLRYALATLFSAALPRVRALRCAGGARRRFICRAAAALLPVSD